jgi:hypothetical protein
VSDTSFTKLFSSITKSTVWCEPHTTVRVWITMLADCDRRGEVHGSVPGLANLARVTVAECETALATFLAPDPYSRTPDNEGRRIETIPGGWRLLNYDHYRGKKDEGAVREQKRDHNRRVRAEESANSTCGKNNSTNGNENPKWNKSGFIAEAEADTDKSNSKSERARPAPLVLPDWLPADAWGDWHAYRNGRKGWTHKARELSLRKLTELWALGHDPRVVIEQSIERGWTGLFPVHEDRARAGPVSAKPGKQMQGLMALEAMKSGNRMADGRSADGPAKALPALTGRNAGR